ncbi:hypothetical protein [Fusobacterium sp. PH5-44]|uniref:hypothetical protein n=1 Tax=unclassified Fusobacterium TaxID=2648384 RepID=UPI003D1AC353
MIKVRFLLFFLLCCNSISSTSVYNFLRENEIILTIKKIPISGIIRHPTEKIYISSNLKILYTNYVQNKSDINHDYYFYTEIMEEYELERNINSRLMKGITALNNRDLTNVDLKHYNKLKYFYSIIDQEDGQVRDFKVAGKEADFRCLYAVEFVHSGEELTFILGDKIEVYEDQDIQNFIMLLNEIIEFIQNKKNKV